MYYDPSCKPVKQAPASLDDFMAWLRTKPPNETYDFQNCDGACVMGQYMAFKGYEWGKPFSRKPSYCDLVRYFFGHDGPNTPLCGKGGQLNWTFGACLKRCEEFKRRSQPVSLRAQSR